MKILLSHFLNLSSEIEAIPGSLSISSNSLERESNRPVSRPKFLRHSWAVRHGSRKLGKSNPNAQTPSAIAIKFKDKFDTWRLVNLVCPYFLDNSAYTFIPNPVRGWVLSACLVRIVCLFCPTGLDP